MFILRHNQISEIRETKELETLLQLYDRVQKELEADGLDTITLHATIIELVKALD